jgi:hypothetical protein
MSTPSPLPDTDSTDARRTGRPRSATERNALTGLLIAVGVFEVALAAGAPWGRFAWGGATDGVLPTSMRISSGVGAAAYVAIAATARAGPTTPVRRRVLRGLGVLMGIGTLLNLASPSWGEKLIWTPVAAALAVLLWRRASADA